jgi:GTP-binding protein HflX
VVEDLIAKLGAGDKPCLKVYNKCDAYIGILPQGENVVCISARTGEGADELIRCLSGILEKESRRVSLCLPYDRAGLLDLLRREAAVLDVQYAEDGVRVEAVVKPELWGRVRDFVENGGSRDEDD